MTRRRMVRLWEFWGWAYDLAGEHDLKGWRRRREADRWANLYLTGDLSRTHLVEFNRYYKQRHGKKAEPIGDSKTRLA